MGEGGCTYSRAFELLVEWMSGENNETGCVCVGLWIWTHACLWLRFETKVLLGVLHWANSMVGPIVERLCASRTTEVAST